MALVPEPMANTSHYGAIALTCLKSINQLFTACQVCNRLPRVIFFPTTLPSHQVQWLVTMNFLTNDHMVMQ